MTYHDDKGAEHGHRMNESSVGSTDYWNHRMQQQNHQSMADAQRLHQGTSSYLQNLQAQHTAPPVWRAGELPVGAGHVGTHSGSAGAALARLLGTKGFWYIAWLLLCACGYQWVDQGIRSAHATGWMQAVTPAGHVSSDYLIGMRQRPEGFKYQVDQTLGAWAHLFRQPEAARKLYAACPRTRACLTHPLGIMGFMADHASDRQAYWQALCESGYVRHHAQGKSMERRWWVAPHQTQKYAPQCVLVNAQEVRDQLARSRQWQEGVAIAAALVAALLPWLAWLWLRRTKSPA